MLVKMTAANLTQWIAWGRVIVKEMHGYNAQGASVFIQFHQEPVLTAGDVPTCASFQCFANDGFMFSFGTQGIELSELTVGMSTTEANFTSVAASGGLDITLDIDTQFAVDGTETIVGDLTTGQNALQVWSEATGAAGAQRLLRVDIQDNQNVDQLVALIYAVDSVLPTSLVTSFFSCKKNSITTQYYGDNQGRFSPYQQDKNYTQHRGCTINVTSLSNGYWTAGTVYGGTAPNIRAIYKPV